MVEEHLSDENSQFDSTPLADAEISLFESNTKRSVKPDVPLTSTVDHVPILRVSLFGGFQISREVEDLDMSAMNRHMARKLLSDLVLCSGKDLNCSHLARVLWPEGMEMKNRHNFYNLWSLLRTALVLRNGTCPYIMRRQNSCKLVEEYVASDVMMMERLCSRLQFECNTVDEVLATYRAIIHLYSGPLLPGEDDNSIINRERWSWQNRIVDCLNIAATSLYFMEEYVPAVWLAQAAMVVDPAREDVCQILMQSYVAVGAKAAALQAYYKLQSSIRELLGVDPADSITDYFNAVLVDDYEVQREIVASTAHLTTFALLGNQSGSDLEKIKIFDNSKNLPAEALVRLAVEKPLDKAEDSQDAQSSGAGADASDVQDSEGSQDDEGLRDS